MSRRLTRRGLFLGLLATGLVLAPVPPVHAQAVFGVNLSAGLPAGDFGDIAKVGFGGAASIGTMLGESVLLKAEGGYWRFSSEGIDLTGIGTVEVEGGFVPIRVGLRKYWGESKRFFTGPNLGIYVPTSDLDGLDPKFGLGPQIGFRFPTAGGTSFDVIAELHTILIGDENPITEMDRTVFEDSKIIWFSIGVGVTFGTISG